MEVLLIHFWKGKRARWTCGCVRDAAAQMRTQTVEFGGEGTGCASACRLELRLRRIVRSAAATAQHGGG